MAKDAILHFIDSTGVDNIIYPKSTTDNISVDVSLNDKLPSDAATLSDILSKLGSLAFTDLIGYDDIDPSIITTDLDIVSSGYIADARVVPVILDKLTEVSNKVQSGVDHACAILASVVAPTSLTS